MKPGQAQSSLSALLVAPRPRGALRMAAAALGGLGARTGLYIYIYICIQTLLHVYIYISRYMNIHIYIHVCVHTGTYVHI